MSDESENVYQAMLDTKQRVASAGMAHISILRGASAAFMNGDTEIADATMKIVSAENDAYTASEAGIRNVMNARKWFAVHNDEARFVEELEKAYTEYMTELEAAMTNIDNAIDGMHKAIERKQSQASQEP